MEMYKPTEDKINTVFANRKDYDAKRYIPRPKYERDLQRELDRWRYVFVTGESGSGKTWLVDYYLSTNEKEKKYINLAEVGLAGSLMSYLEKSAPQVKTEDKLSAKANVSIPVLSGSGELTSTFQINNDYLWDFIEENKDRIIVFDNFESIIQNKELLNDISCLITLADDPRMRQYNPHFLIIGALKDVLQYFRTMPNYQTIESRVSTVLINGFTEVETDSFVNKGFTECGFNTSKMKGLTKRIFDLTWGFPQAVNELCYYIAISHYDANETDIKFPSEAVYRAEKELVRKSMMAESLILKGYFDENNHSNPLLNYILYASNNIGMKEFSAEKILATAEQYIRESEKMLPITQVKDFLNMLSEQQENRNILIRTKNNGYRFKSYKTFSCISVVLDIKNDEVIFIDYLNN